MYKSIERFLIAVAATVGFGFANLFAGTIHQEYDGPWHWDELTRQTKSLDWKSFLLSPILLCGAGLMWVSFAGGRESSRAVLSAVEDGRPPVHEIPSLSVATTIRNTAGSMSFSTSRMVKTMSQNHSNKGKS